MWLGQREWVAQTDLGGQNHGSETGLLPAFLRIPPGEAVWGGG